MAEPVLFTPRLMLRLPQADDLDAWADFHADAQTMQHLGGVQTRSEAWRGLCAMRGAWAIRGFAMFSVIERDSGRWVGRIGPWQPDGWPGTEIGWGVARGFEGTGYAFEAASAAIDFAVDMLGWNDIIHVIAPDNHRSAVLAARLGSQRLEPTRLPAPLQDMPVNKWGQSASDWRARRQVRTDA